MQVFFLNYTLEVSILHSSYGILSLLPVAVSLVLSFWKKNVFMAILSGLFTGAIIIGANVGSFFIGFDAIASVFTSASTAKTTYFLLLTGSLVYVVGISGGVEGLIVYLTEKKNIVKSKVGVQLMCFVAGLFIFIDATSSIAITALLGKPFFEKYKLPKEKLALISNSTGSPITWLIPFGGAGALLTSIVNNVLLSMGLDESAFNIVVKSTAFQFYSITILLIVATSIIFNFEIGSIKKITKEINKNVEITYYKTKIPNGKEALARNMVVPIIFLIISIFTILFFTGNGNPMLGDGATAVFTSGCLTLFITAIYYIYQKITTMETYIEWCFEGMKSIFPIVVILVLAYAFGDIISQLGTAQYIAEFTQYIPYSIMLFMILMISAVISFSSGSSSAAIILLMPIMMPIAYSNGIPFHYVIGAVVSGSVFGDQSSPISDSVILTSSVTGVDIMNHVKTQLPYSGLSLGISAILFIVIGFNL